jgi:hypothetical protein
VSANDDFEQARIGRCLIIRVLDQHPHLAPDALEAYRHRQCQDIIGYIGGPLALHRRINRLTGEQHGQTLSRDGDLDAVGPQFHAPEQGRERGFDLVWLGYEFFGKLRTPFDQLALSGGAVRSFVGGIEDRAGIGEERTQPVDDQAFHMTGRYTAAGGPVATSSSDERDT